MPMKKLLTLLLLLPSSSLLAVTISTVPVGNTGNAPDLVATFNNAYGLAFGSVDYDYRIGTTEVTNSQYAEFLNAKARDNLLLFYNSSSSGIAARQDDTGRYTYSVKPNMGNKPVIGVSWYDAARFVNWLHNGQGDGDTETGAYTLAGKNLSDRFGGLSVTRNAGATWFLPNENEWYKAAYYNPTLNDNTGGYWLYATQSNAMPTPATATGQGDVSNPGPNVANFALGAQWNGMGDNVTTVGSAGPLSESFYHTSDQSGNVVEWMEDLDTKYSDWRILRGGAWATYPKIYLASWGRESYGPDMRSRGVGFRVATIPEPPAYVLAALSVLGLLAARRRKR
jgi:formylglycine-generating enzyme required for sulfatase activity